MASNPSITLIAGPTASGKSRLAMEMAERTGGVIINADSQQIYADLRILSARPTPEDELLVPHHLYGVADAADIWSVGRWSRAATTLIDDLRTRGRSILIVGGTGLYFAALTKGLADIPAVATDVRDAAGSLHDAEGESAFRARLAAVDAGAARTIEVGDRQRLVRAFSVATATGRSLSDWHADTRPILPAGTYGRLVIEPPRDGLYAACDRRVETMVRQGGVEEVRRLMDRRLNLASPIMKAVGVREFSAYLAGQISKDEAIATTQQATRRYAKRQLTWFRNQVSDWPRVAL